MFTRDNFPYEQYLRDVQGATDDDIPEEGLTEDQKNRTYQTAIREFQKDFRSKLSGSNTRRDSIQDTIDRFDGAREVLGVPEQTDSARLDINGLVEHFETVDPSGILGGRTLKDLTKKYADTFTKGDDAYFRYEQFRGDKNITTDDHKKNIERQLLEQLGGSESPFSEDTVLSEAINTLNISKSEGSLDAEATETSPSDVGVIQSTARGAGAGFLDVVGKAVEGISTLGNTLALKSGLGDIRFFEEDQSGDFNLFNYYSAEELEEAFQKSGSLSNDLIGNLGNSIQDLATNVNEEADPNSTSNKVGYIGGQLLGFITAGVAGRTPGAVSAAVLSGSEFQLDDYEATLLEKGEEGFNVDEAQNVALLGGAVGSLEALPVFKALGRLAGTTSTPKILKWLDENSSGGILKLIKTGTAGAIEEGLQEVVSQIASNLVASDLIEYDPERNLFQGTQEAGEMGAAAGGVINTLIGLIAGKRNVSSSGPPENVDPNTEVEQAIQATQNVESATVEPEPTSVEGPRATPVDEDGNPLPPPPDELPGTIKPTSDGAVAVVNGQVIVGSDASEVQSKLDTTLSSIIPLGGDVQIDEPSIEQTGSTASIRDTDDNAIVTFEGRRPSSQIEQLVERHNDDSDFKLIKGIKIKEAGDNFIVSLGPHTVRVTNIVDGVDQIVEMAAQTGVSSRVNLSQIEEQQTPITIEVEQPKGRARKNLSGFRAPRFKGIPTRKKGETPEDLALRKIEFAQGQLGPDFTVITVSPTIIKATKDGLNYEINIGKNTTSPNTKRRKGNKGNAITANVVVTDKQGRLVEDPVNQNKPLTSVKGDPLNSSFDVRTPQVGFRIIRETQAGELQPPRLDAANIESVAKRSGGTVTVATADYAQIDYGGENVAITLSDEGAVVHLEDGQVFKVTSEFFNLENGVNSASIITQQLVEAGYEIKSQSGGRTKLVNKEEGRELTVKDNGFDATITEGKKEVILEEIIEDPISPALATMFSEEGLSFDIDPIEAEVSRSNTVITGPASNNSVNDRVQTTLDRIQIIEGKPTVLNDDGSATVYEVPEAELQNLLFDIETAGSQGENVQLSTIPESELLSTKEDWDHSELVDLVDKVFHPRIASTIRLHDKSTAAVFGLPKNGGQVVGFFAPNGDGSGRYIHVNASKQRGNLHSVLDTISEEVAHFGFDTFTQNNKAFEKLYRNLYNIVLPEILVSDNMRRYITGGKIDTNNPKPPEIYMLVNEYFSKLGVSFMDFTSTKVGLPLGMDRPTFNSIRKSVQNARVDDVVIDLTKDVDPNMKEEAMNLVRNVIRLQTSAVRGVGFNVQFQTERDDGTPGVLRIRSTPYGRASSFTPATSEAKRIRKLKDLNHKRGEYSKMSTAVWNIRKFLQSLSLTNTPIGRERSIAISDLVSNESKVRAEGLQSLLRRRQSLNKVFVDFNIPPIDPGASYVEALVEAGVPQELRSGLLGRKTVLEVAKELDGLLKDGSRVKYENIAAIHNEFRKAKKQLIAWARNDETGILAETLTAKIIEIENKQATYTADWSHRRYDVDTRVGLKRLKVMLNDLESDVRGKDSTESAQQSDQQYLGNLHDQAARASLQIESIENNPADAGVNANRELARLNEIVDLSERMTALYNYVIASAGTKNGRADQESIQDAMRRKLSETIRRSEQKSRIGTGKLNDVDSDKGRELDMNNDADKLLAKFLGPLTDPSESMIFDLEQQGLILSSLGSANALAIDLVADTIARPEGLPTGDFTVDSKSKLLARQQQGTLLEYIEVDSTFVDHIERSLKITGNIQFTALNNLIGEMKRNLTVRSGFGITSSYVGNISMMMSSGHIFTLDHYRTLPQNLKDAWQLRFNASFSGENGSNKIVNEMAHHNLLGSGVSTATVELSATNTIQKITDLLDTYIQSDRVQEIGDAVQRVDNNIAKVFSFSDDFPKMLPYAMNRELGVLEAELALPRDTFGNSDTEQQRYEDAIDDFASRFAAERTRRETVNWELSPQFLKEMASSNIRLFTPDFVGHMVQMVRTLTENHIMIVEDTKKAILHNREGNDELYTHYRNAAIKRAVGTGVNDAVWYGLGTGTYSIVADMMRGLYQQVDEEDDPDLPLKERTNYSDEEWAAAKGMAKIYSEVTGVTYDAGPWRNGEKAVMMGYARANASLSFVNTTSIDDYEIPSTTFETAEAIKSFIGNFLAIDDSTIINTLYMSWFLGKDKFGRPTTTSDKIKDGMRLLTPQMVQQAHQVATGERMFSQSKLNQMYVLGTNFTGIKMREVSYPRLIYQYGQSLNRFKSTSSSTQPKALIDKLNSGISLTDKEVEVLVASYRNITDGKFNEAQAAVGYMKGVGYSNKQIQQNLNTDPNGVTKNGLAKSDAELLLKNENFFDAAMKRSLKGRIKQAKKEKPTTDRLSSQELDNKRLNLERALGYYN